MMTGGSRVANFTRSLRSGSWRNGQVSKVTDHNGQGTNAIFKIEYMTGDRVWLPHHKVTQLEAVSQYLEALGAPGIQHLPKKISNAPTNIAVATVHSFPEARHQVSLIVGQMLDKLPSQTNPISLKVDGLKTRGDWTTPNSRATLSYPMSMSVPASPNKYALGAFTWFFHAEVQVKELATRKEAHAFDQMLKSEREHNYSCLSQLHRGANLSIDNRNHQRVPQSRNTAPTQRVTHPTPPLSTAQVISATISSNSAATPPIVNSPPPTDNPGPDILDIISAGEQSYLMNSAHPHSMTESELFGRVVVLGLLATNVLTLLALIAAFGSMEVHSNLLC
ncbi:uncharacterized protein EDB91DRAFT_1251155 [Suillus paluster]|uniref:uncharacterized protein n=1 Tax=Suillus paluster TaxID=48578 RepID=UPI001B8695C5|nr:uncharacterized protein EDB91DRAFT_1251155 [Suillus paluster]KAG1733848.1 hypothetical protein EDB91DRAFT_1251155 [Suillus paluster]